MKIEKINDNQIRCTLTRQDLEDHQIRLSELAYGTEKAKQLFRDMMQQAQIQFGFEADNIPLMIEAIPVNTESIILIITKVEDPEELDTRFSKFSPFKGNPQTNPLQLDGADNILDLIQKLRDAKGKSSSGQKPAQTAPAQEAIEAEEEAAAPVHLVQLYQFSRLDDIIQAAKGLSGMTFGPSRLYKEGCLYQMVLHQGETSPEDFNRIHNILSEYASGRSLSSAGEAYLAEHAKLISDQPLTFLSQLG